MRQYVIIQIYELFELDIVRFCSPQILPYCIFFDVKNVIIIMGDFLQKVGDDGPEYATNNKTLSWMDSLQY